MGAKGEREGAPDSISPNHRPHDRALHATGRWSWSGRSKRLYFLFHGDGDEEKRPYPGSTFVRFDCISISFFVPRHSILDSSFRNRRRGTARHGGNDAGLPLSERPGPADTRMTMVDTEGQELSVTHNTFTGARLLERRG